MSQYSYIGNVFLSRRQLAGNLLILEYLSSLTPSPLSAGREKQLILLPFLSFSPPHVRRSRTFGNGNYDLHLLDVYTSTASYESSLGPP